MVYPLTGAADVALDLAGAVCRLARPSSRHGTVAGPCKVLESRAQDAGHWDTETLTAHPMVAGLHTLSLTSVLLAPLSRHLKLALPDALAAAMGCVFCRDVLLCELPACGTGQ